MNINSRIATCVWVILNSAQKLYRLLKGSVIGRK